MNQNELDGGVNSDDHYIYYCGQESIWRHGIALKVNKSPHAVLQVSAPATDAEEAEVDQFCEYLQAFLELPLKIDVCFITGDQKAEVESQKIPRITGKAGIEV